MVYPVGETAKLPDLVKNIREEDVPERFRVELRADGTLKELGGKYFGQDISSEN